LQELGAGGSPLWAVQLHADLNAPTSTPRSRNTSSESWVCSACHSAPLTAITMHHVRPPTMKARPRHLLPLRLRRHSRHTVASGGTTVPPNGSPHIGQAGACAAQTATIRSWRGSLTMHPPNATTAGPASLALLP